MTLRDLKAFPHVASEIDQHLEAGAQAFLIDMRNVNFGYTANSGKFLELWLPVLKSRRARVAFLLARRTERKKHLLRKLVERTGFGFSESPTNDYWHSLGTKRLINVFDDPEEANAFLRSDSPDGAPDA